MTPEKEQRIIHATHGDTASGGRHQIGTLAGLKSVHIAGFILECVADFIGIRIYGFQIGVNGKILELGRFSLDGLIKIGIFNNDAEQSTGVSLQKVVYPTSATANHAAFASEASLQLKYQVMRGMALKAGYEALWLDGIALAPGQIQETLTTLSGVRALGVNCGSSVLFQGITAGLEYAF